MYGHIRLLVNEHDEDNFSPKRFLHCELFGEFESLLLVFPGSERKQIRPACSLASGIFSDKHDLVPFFSKKCHQLVIVIHGLVQGGPGASSMFGALKEHGPFLADVKLDGEPFVKHNPYSWSGNHSVIYVDNPVGTGFSFTDDPDDFPSFVEETTEVNIFESKATLKKKLSENTSISGLVQPSAAVLPAVS